LGGKMYDVAKINMRENYITVYCIRDEKEEMLISNYEKVFRNNSSPDKINSRSLAPLFTIQLIAIPIKLSFPEKNSASNIFFGNYINNYLPTLQEFPTPPPRIV
jgi:hypothetical protein